MKSTFVLSDNPLESLKELLSLAQRDVPNPETQGQAMTVATVNGDGAPSTRVVLIKDFTENGFIFYTNYDSHKGLDLAANHKIAVNFHWPHLGRQVSITATTKKTTRQVSETYWASRPRGSQISQCISEQSRPVPEGRSLAEMFEAFQKEWEGKEIPCPANWGGYEVTPLTYQFWQAKQNRLHDRVEFYLENSEWKSRTLFP